MLQHPRHNKKISKCSSIPFTYTLYIDKSSLRKSMVRIVHYYVPYIRIRITQYSR